MWFLKSPHTLGTIHAKSSDFYSEWTTELGRKKRGFYHIHVLIGKEPEICIIFIIFDEQIGLDRFLVSIMITLESSQFLLAS